MMDRRAPYMPPDWAPPAPRNPIEADTDGSAVAIVFIGLPICLLASVLWWWWA